MKVNEENLRGAYAFARELLGWGPGREDLADVDGTIVALGRELETLRRERAGFVDKLTTQGTAAKLRIEALSLEVERLRAGGGIVPLVADVSVRLKSPAEWGLPIHDVYAHRYVDRAVSDRRGPEAVEEAAYREHAERFPSHGPTPTKCALCGHFNRERCGHWVGRL